MCRVSRSPASAATCSSVEFHSAANRCLVAFEETSESDGPKRYLDSEFWVLGLGSVRYGVINFFHLVGEMPHPKSRKIASVTRGGGGQPESIRVVVDDRLPKRVKRISPEAGPFASEVFPGALVAPRPMAWIQNLVFRDFTD